MFNFENDHSALAVGIGMVKNNRNAVHYNSYFNVPYNTYKNCNLFHFMISDIKRKS